MNFCINWKHLYEFLNGLAVITGSLLCGASGALWIIRWSDGEDAVTGWGRLFLIPAPVLLLALCVWLFCYLFTR